VIHKLERDGGVWFARGGTNALVADGRHFERLGGTHPLDDPVEAIGAADGRVRSVRTKAAGPAISMRSRRTATWSDLRYARPQAGDSGGGTASPETLLALMFVVHFSTNGDWPDVPHHTILFGPRYKGLLNDIYRGAKLADDPSLYLHHPTATDPEMAPPGKSTFYVLAPVPHLGRAPIDWEREGPIYRDRILQILEERMMPGLRERVDNVFHFGPREFDSELNSHLGSAFSLEPILTQSAWFRVHNRDDKIPNLYFVGAGTHPGAGIPGVVGSAKATAGLMIEDLLR
jgi:phytoene desaturase